MPPENFFASHSNAHFTFLTKVRKTQYHLLIPFTLCGLLLAGAIFWQVVHGQRLGALEDRRQHLGREIRVARSVVTGILDAETGQRGFLLTAGREQYLEPYNRAREKLKADFKELHQLLAKETIYADATRRIEKNVEIKLKELDETISAWRRGDRAGALQTVMTDRGRAYMDTVRAQLAALIDTMSEERSQIWVEAAQRIHQVRNGLIWMSIFIGAILVFTYFLVARAESQRAAFAAHLEYAAHHDQLTGLPNRHYLKSHFGELLQQAETKRERLALFYIDLDHFKAVNDKYGHDVGDKVLKDAAVVMRSLLGETAKLVRLGGDEFALIYTRAPVDATLAGLARDMIQNLRSVTLADGSPSGISASIGVAVFPENSQNESDLFHVADAAMYRAKHAGRACFTFANDSIPLPSRL